MNDREKLIRMIGGGGSGRVRVIPLRFGDDESPDEIFVDSTEADKLLGEGQEDLFLLGVRPESREEVLRDSPCLVRQADGTFKAVNIGKGGPVYLVLD